MKWQPLLTTKAHGELVLMKWQVDGKIRYKVGRIDHDGFGFMCQDPDFFEYLNIRELIDLKAFYISIKEIGE